MLLIVFLGILISALIVPPLLYYAWMKSKTKTDWGLAIDPDYRPKVSLIIATYNEATVIEKKLENVQKLIYPQDKLQVILVDSASTDGTLDVCKSFNEKNHLRYPVKLLSERQRFGKSHALNVALEYAEGEIIATSDADAFWAPDALLKAVMFFVNLSVGAISGREKLANLKKSIHTMSEGLYREFYYTLRLGESKIHSTLIFQGELSLYRRTAFDKFEDTAGCSDDTGTVINIISKGFRCIFIPESVFYDTAAFSLKGRMMLKSRRAQHLIAGLTKSLRFRLAGKLAVPWIIILFNFYLHVISPLLLLFVAATAIATFFVHFSVLWYLLLLVPLLLVKKLRLFVVSYLTSNLALVMGIMLNLRRKRSTSWRRIDEMRKY